MIEAQKKYLEEYAKWNICGNRIKDLKRVLSESGLEKQWFRGKFCGNGIEVTYHLERLEENKVFVGTDVSLFAESTDKALPIYRAIGNYLVEFKKTQEAICPYSEGGVDTGYRCRTKFIGEK